MSTLPLVEQFYSRIWNSSDENVETVLADDFCFRESLGPPAHGHSESLN
jgi:hypothetical protein